MAIARDRSGLANYGGSGNTVTISSYVNGGNAMVAFVYSTSNDVTSVKWNGTESFTQIGSAQQIGGFGQYITAWYLANPTVKTANIVATKTSSSNISVAVISYTGAGTTQDSFNSISETASGDRAAAVTVVAAGCWIATVCNTNNADPSAAFNGLVLQNAFGVANGLVDSNGTVGTGSQSVGFHWASSDQHGIFAVAIKPLASSISPSISPSFSPSLSPSISPSISPSLSPSVSPSVSPSSSLSPSVSPSVSPSSSLSPSVSPSVSPSASQSPSTSPSISPSFSPSVSPSSSLSPSISPSKSPSISPSVSPSSSISPSISPSVSPSSSLSPSVSPSVSPSSSISPSPSPQTWTDEQKSNDQDWTREDKDLETR